MSPVVGIVAISVALTTTFAVLRLWQARAARTPDPELVRKLAHLAAGGAALSFPWFFDALWPGLLLCALGFAAALTARLWGPARRSIGRVVSDVQRRSVGDLCLPIGVAVVWMLSGGDWVLHTIPVAFLTLGDAAAALVGRHLGRLRYRTTEGHKSVEGSSVLLVTGFATAAAILAGSGTVAAGDAVLIALTLAILVTLAEAIAWRGLDNLILPVFAAVLLEIYVRTPTPDLVVRLLVLGTLAAGVILLRSRTTLIAEGLIATTLFLYAYWTLGGWPWLAAPLALLVLWPLVPSPHQRSLATSLPQAVHGVGPVLAIAGPSLVCLLLHAAEAAPLLPISVASLAGATTIVILVQMGHVLETDSIAPPPPGRMVIAIVAGATTAAFPTLLIASVAPAHSVPWLTLALVGAAVAALLAFAPPMVRRTSSARPWILRGGAIAAATVIAALLMPLLPFDVAAEVGR